MTVRWDMQPGKCAVTGARQSCDTPLKLGAGTASGRTATIMGRKCGWNPQLFYSQHKGGHLLKENKYTDFHDLPLMLTTQEIGEMLGIPRAAAHDLVCTEGFPHIRIGKRILVPKDKFICWIADQRSPA